MKTAPGRWLLAWEARSPIRSDGSPTGVTQIYTNFSNGLSDSDEFQITVDKRFSQGFALRAAYTVGKDDRPYVRFPFPFLHVHRSTGSPTGSRRCGFRCVPTPSHQRHLAIAPRTAHFRQRLHEESCHGLAIQWHRDVSGRPASLRCTPITTPASKDNGLDRPDIIGPIQYLNPRSTTTSFDSSTASCLGGPATGNFWFNP